MSLCVQNGPSIGLLQCNYRSEDVPYSIHYSLQDLYTGASLRATSRASYMVGLRLSHRVNPL